MSQFYEGNHRSFVSAATFGRCLRVKLAAGLLVLAGATDLDVGVVTRDVNDTVNPYDVLLHTANGTTQVVASGAITAGAYVYGDTGGKITATGSGTPSSEVQTVTISGAPTGGSFFLTANNQTTTALAFNASTAAVQTALQALPSIGAGNVLVTGTAGSSYVLTFAGTLANLPQTLVTINGTALTGGTPAWNSVRTTPGITALTGSLPFGIALSAASANGDIIEVMRRGGIPNPA